MTNILTRTIRLLTALARINVSFVSSRKFRTKAIALMLALRATKDSEATRSAEEGVVNDAELVFEGLSDVSLTFSRLQLVSQAPRLNVVVPAVRPNAVFAGVATALEVAASLAERLGFGLRIIMTNLADGDAVGTAELMRRRFGMDAEVVLRADLHRAAMGDHDLWLATHWKTAHAIQVAADLGRIERSRVVYLIQDYEPGFNAWSTDYVLAQNTYHAGFLPLVNSTLLASHLRKHERLHIDPDLVFSPAFDLDLLERTHAARTSRDGVTVLYYARPSKPRNLYQLGVSALRVAARELGAEVAPVSFISAGEPHAPVPLGAGATLRSVGTLPWDEYFELIATAQVVLSLQESPHPSHPPFDAAISGAFAVTNAFDGSRAKLHDRLAAVPGTPQELGGAVARSVRRARAEGVPDFTPLADGVLGRPLAAALDHLAGLLSAR